MYSINKTTKNKCIVLFVDKETFHFSTATTNVSTAATIMRIAILGGGISGLSTAYYLKKSSIPISKVRATSEL